MSNMWATPKDDPRTYGDPVGELATYREYLDNYRLTITMPWAWTPTSSPGGRCRPAP
jgi:hypothetical protein